MTGRVSVTAEVVGIDSDGTEPSVVFAVHRHGVYSADKTLLKRYLFNCGEGTQRLCGENGIKLSSLDAIFLTRLDVRSASGIPGLVFALGGLGAATLTIHGPKGSRDRLRAMESFVRRKYPKIECVEVDGKMDDPHADIPKRRWATGNVLEDQHARFLAFALDSDQCAKREGGTEAGCWFCAKCAPLKKPVATAAALEKLKEDEDTDPDRAWLRRFYEKNGLHDELPHLDTILRRYRGRVDELKAQLTAKYGNSDDQDASSDEDDSSSDEGTAASTPLDLDAPLDRTWLEAFYNRHEPAKAARVDQILRQFAGREDQLKAMLLAKYDTTGHSDAPPAKKSRLDETTTAPEALQATQEESIKEVFVDTRPPSTHEPEDPPGGSLCFAIQFKSPPFPTAWVVDCRSTHDIDSLFSRLRPADCSHSPVLVVHFTRAKVFHHHRYQRWIEEIRSSGENFAQHLLFDGRALREVDGGVFSFAFTSSARNFVAEHGGDGKLPGPRWERLGKLLASGSVEKERLQVKLLRRLGDSNKPAHVAQAKLRYTLEDTAVADHSRTGWRYYFDKRVAQDTDEDSTVVVTPPARPPILTRGDRALSILGTGSAAPSKLRASTSMYLSLSSDAESNGALPGMLIDCGEGAYGQLQRQFDSESVLLGRLAGLQCIWISHHHADHQCGILRVLDEYLRATQTPPFSVESKLFVVAPQTVLDYVTAWLPDLPSRVRLATCTEINESTHELKSHLVSYVHEMRSVRVWHCYDAYGLILRLADGTKLVYSGDTKPCDQLVRAGMDASLLIHEATFDDSMEEDADKKKHSTVGQALEIARRMRAKRVVLTHFSQRYPSLPPPMSDVPERDAAAHPQEIYCASDGFTIPV